MRFAILTLGTRGDVQPFVALGRELQQAGHDATLVTAGQFADFVSGNGLKFAPVDPRFLAMMDTSAGQAIFDGGGNPLGVIRMAMPIMRQVLHDSWVGAQGSEAIIYHQKMLAAYHIAEKLRIPAFMAMPLPVYPTQAFTNPLVPVKLPAALNRISYAANSGGRAPFMGIVNQFRKEELGLPARGRFSPEDRTPDGRPIPVLHAYSPAVVPIPADWPEHVTATGYWFLDGDPAWQPPPGLLDFLAAGPPPVYVGFGSMVTQDPSAKTAAIIEALRLADQRGVIASGWAGLDAAQIPETIYRIDSAPHDWLFPRVAAVVHHGGAGTTAAGLRAGRPTVVAPFFGDQMFWGHRVSELGAGPEPVPQKKLTAGRLAAAIEQAVSDGEIRARAAAIGEQIRAENGAARAVRFIEAWLQQPPDQSHIAAKTASRVSSTVSPRQ